MATFPNNKKKDYFLCMATFSKMDLGALPYLRWSSLQQLVMVWTMDSCGNSIISTAKIKIGWKWLCLEEGIRYDFLFCRHVFTFFWKRQLLFTNILFHFRNNYKNENWWYFIVDFIFWGFINRSNHQNIFWKMLSIKCRKTSCEGVPFL